MTEGSSISVIEADRRTLHSQKSTIFPGFSTREEVTAYLQSHREMWQKFCLLPEKFREELIGYCMGKNGLAVTYDSVFKKVFNPETHRERVESLLSALLKRSVKIKDILPLEGVSLTEKGSFVILDMLVELDDGSFADLEMQKIGYKFPLERSDCYGADMIMRQYNRLRNKQKEGVPFNFSHMQKVFCIILMEQSSKEFLMSDTTAEETERPLEYVHGRWMQFDTGIMKESRGLHEDVFVCLDLFRQNAHNITKDSPMLDAWLTFLSATDVETITKLAAEFPEFLEIYREIAEFVGKPEELMMMFSEELYIMDRNTEREMLQDIETDKKQLENDNRKLKDTNKELKDTNKELKDTNKELKDENAELKKRIDELQAQLAGRNEYKNDIDS